MAGRKTIVEHDLKALLARLVEEQQGVEEIYLFGSRAYRTGSLRSDCDLIVRINPEAATKSSDLRDFAIDHCGALDLFLCSDARAVSCANDSFVFAATFSGLIAKLDAVLLWTRENSFTDFSFGEQGSWVFHVAEGVDFIPTTLPNTFIDEQAWIMKSRSVERAGLPIRPYIGDTLDKAAGMINDVARRMVFNSRDLGPRGVAASGWTVDLRSEYDCQNLFFSVAKPWLPELAREEIAIVFDDQKKLSDFSLFGGKLIIEMKFIDDGGTKAAVVKTLLGLQDFYSRNANVGLLLFVVYVKAGTVDIDTAKWEAEFSFATKQPRVITTVVVVP